MLLNIIPFLVISNSGLVSVEQTSSGLFIFGVHQGSVLGLLMFSLYSSPFSKVIGSHPHIRLFFYADDSQLYVHLSNKNASTTLTKLNACLWNVP